MATYVQAHGSDNWHWCRNCSNYPAPQNIARRRNSRPSTDLCNQCRSKERDGTCRA